MRNTMGKKGMTVEVVDNIDTKIQNKKNHRSDCG
jgi:hypothetical protein